MERALRPRGRAQGCGFSRKVRPWISWWGRGWVAVMIVSEVQAMCSWELASSALCLT